MKTLKTPSDIFNEIRKIGKYETHIETFIKERAKTKAIPKMCALMQAAVNELPEDITCERTSQIFIDHGTKRGEARYKYFPILGGAYISHLILRTAKKR